MRRVVGWGRVGDEVAGGVEGRCRSPTTTQTHNPTTTCLFCLCESVQRGDRWIGRLEIRTVGFSKRIGDSSYPIFDSLLFQFLPDTATLT